MSDELPLGWASAQVGELFASHGGGTPNRGTPACWNGNIPWLSSGDIKATTISESSETITKRGLEESAARLCRRGSVLVVVRSGILKHTLPVAVLKREASINQDIKAFDSSDDQLNRWLALAWRASARDLLAENREGTTVQSVKLETLLNFVLPIPPLPEQRRIVAKLEKLLGQVDACQKRLAKIRVLLKRFRQSVLAAACCGRLTADWREENQQPVDSDNSDECPDGFPTLPETWRWNQLEAVCTNVVDCPHSTPKWTEDGQLCVRTTNFQPGFLDLSDVRHVPKETFAERIERLRPQPGDIIYSREGGILGIACIIPPKVELCLGQRMMLFRTRPDFSASLLMHWLNSPVIFRRVRELTGGSASPHLNVRDIKSFQIPNPPLIEQQEIVRRVEGLFALADQIEARLAAAQRQVDALTPSLLARAFAGKLVPQDPTDEPASTLLDRIRSRSSDQKGRSQ